MTNNEALEILNEHWSGRIDSPDRPDFDDINEALGKMEDAVKQLAEKDKELKRQLKENKRLNKNFDLSRNARIRYTNKLKQQLAEKDKEIEELKSNLKFACEQIQMLRQLMQDTVKDTRHQVCEEIREKLKLNEQLDLAYTQNTIDCLWVAMVLDQIEGENK